MLQMKLCGDLVLRQKCAPVSEITPDLLAVLDEMVEMMRAQNGVGLAAPQVGISSRFLVMMDPDSEVVYRMINPNITSFSEDTCVLEEGCLSVLGNDGLPIYANVTRPQSVIVEWTDEHGAQKKAQMSGIPARIVQHEADHLDGKLFVDHLPAVRREMVMRKVKKRK
ncbi:MAG: peptide deformylase [Alphaproteobacteria bacterium]|nr:peptide deformylase [Alphaproteobacteria bacterium]